MPSLSTSLTSEYYATVLPPKGAKGQAPRRVHWSKLTLAEAPRVKRERDTTGRLTLPTERALNILHMEGLRLKQVARRKHARAAKKGWATRRAAK